MAQTDHDLYQLLAENAAGCGLNYDDDEPAIPAPRSGRSYLLYVAEANLRHGCLDATCD